MDHEARPDNEEQREQPQGIMTDTVAVDDETDRIPALPPVPARPVTATERLVSLDLLRGFAVLGILLINIWAYALPFPAAMNPRLIGLDLGWDRVVYAFVHLFAYTKMMPIFGMLFGAGLILFTRRVEERGGRSGRRWFARQWWLLVIGLVHGYLLWNGDILVPYAICGLIAYRARRWRPRTLVMLAMLLMVVPKVGMQGLAVFLDGVRTTAVEADAAIVAGDTLTIDQLEKQEMWHETVATWDPTRQEFDDLVTIMRGSYGDILGRAAPELLVMHLVMYPLGFGWNIVGFMLVGMALFKLGVIQGERSDGFYVRLAIGCYGTGLPAAWWMMGWIDAHHHDFIAMIRIGFISVEVTGPLVALGHIALVVLAGRRGWLGPLAPRLAAAGRMAFTNYLTQTLVCTAIFFGPGFGLFGALDRTALLGVVLAVWVLQLWWSPLWLGHFRFGPLEWLWRSLSYGSRQPLRITKG
ncbi:hypothetical protein DRQ50_07575 [bacterium]|nr:MAG: hypothetical protein DRQ50_07575 [bacterium]